MKSLNALRQPESSSRRKWVEPEISVIVIGKNRKNRDLSEEHKVSWEVRDCFPNLPFRSESGG